MNTTTPAPSVRSLFSSVKPGSRVTIVNRFGQTSTGRCVMRFSTHAVLNMGGRHGTPAVATDDNIAAVAAPRVKRPPARRTAAVLG